MESLETREIEFRIENADERTVVGMAVPYEVEAHGERFARNAVDLHQDAKLYWNHKDVIGVIERGEHTADGYMIRARFAKGTQSADEAYALAQQGVVNKFSVGFIMDEARQDGAVRVVTRAIVKEVSLTPMPWYETADVLGVRSVEETTDPEIPDSANPKEDTVEEITPTDSGLAEVRESIQMLEREIAGINKVEAPVAPAWRSAGEWLKAAVDGDEAAVRLFATTGDSVTTPYDVDLIKLVDASMFGIGDFFSRGTTPATGMTIEYVRLAGVTDYTGDQVDQGDNLGYVQVDLETDSAPINTVGNHIALSRQVIERSTAPFLDSSLRAQANALAKNLHEKVLSTYADTCAAQITANNYVNIGTKTYAEWAGALADAQALYFQPLGLSVEALIVDTQTFKDLIALDGTPVVSFLGEAAGTAASANARGLRGSLCGVPIIVDALLNTNGSQVAFVASSAIRQYTSGAARLSDSDAIALIEKFSLYTYEATVLEIEAIVPAIVD